MTKSEVIPLLTQTPSGTVLLEGRRKISDEMAHQAEQVASWLSSEFPLMRFRSGNATGADEAFSQGVIEVDPSRLEIFAPTARHRAKSRHPDVTYISTADIPTDELPQIESATKTSSPKYERLIDKRESVPQLKSKANYLLRDTLKVAGSPSLDYTVPVLALFYIDPADPDAGGTGHTIRVCRDFGIPVVTQLEWQHWI